MGKAPEPRLRSISLVLEADLLADLDRIAEAESRSRARQIAVFLRQAVRDWGKDDLAAPTAREIAARKGGTA